MCYKGNIANLISPIKKPNYLILPSSMSLKKYLYGNCVERVFLRTNCMCRVTHHSQQKNEAVFSFIHLLSVSTQVNHNEKISPQNTTTASFSLSFCNRNSKLTQMVIIRRQILKAANCVILNSFNTPHLKR